MALAKGAQDGARSTVLVVEDEEIIRAAIADYLRDCGFGVLEASSGERAKAMFLAGAPIELVFSDIQMSPELDGIALAFWIHENHPNVPVMLTSGIAARTQVPTAVCAEGSMFRKPYECAAIAARINVLLNAVAPTSPA